MDQFLLTQKIYKETDQLAEAMENRNTEFIKCSKVWKDLEKTDPIVEKNEGKGDNELFKKFYTRWNNVIPEQEQIPQDIDFEKLIMSGGFSSGISGMKDETEEGNTESQSPEMGDNLEGIQTNGKQQIFLLFPQTMNTLYV